MKPSLNSKDEFKITHFFFPLAGYRMCRWTTSLAQNRSLFNINSITWKIWLTLSHLWSKGGNRGNKLTERVATLPVKSQNISLNCRFHPAFKQSNKSSRDVRFYYMIEVTVWYLFLEFLTCSVSLNIFQSGGKKMSFEWKFTISNLIMLETWILKLT